MNTFIRVVRGFIIVLYGAVILQVAAQPVITKQPSNQTASLFADATFRVSASGEGLLEYQWRLEGAELLGATNAILTITNVQRGNMGSYLAVINNSSGSVTSQAATLSLTAFNSIYEFGFSWTDTHNCSWPSLQYYKNRASNGPLWPEYLSTNMGLPYFEANNYARCGAGPVEILGQVKQATRPAKPQLSLYVVMTGSSLDVTNIPAWNQAIETDVLNTSNAVNVLYTRGAREIVIQNHPDDGSTFPGYVRDFGTNSPKFSPFVELFNSETLQVLNTYVESKPDLRLVHVDLFAKLNQVLAQPEVYGFAKTTIDALDDAELSDKTFNGPGASYAFWDGYHGTTKLQKFIADWTLESLANAVLEKLELTGGSPSVQMKHLRIGRDYRLQKSIDLRVWDEAQTFTATAGTNQWRISDQDAQTYFRLTWEK